MFWFTTMKYSVLKKLIRKSIILIKIIFSWSDNIGMSITQSMEIIV